jgi:hypothetical protein
MNIELETKYNLLLAKVDELKLSAGEFFITEEDVLGYLKTYSIDSFEDLQYMVNFFVDRVVKKIDAL